MYEATRTRLLIIIFALVVAPTVLTSAQLPTRTRQQEHVSPAIPVVKVTSPMLSPIGSSSFPPGGAVWKSATGNWSTPVLVAESTTWEHSAVQEPQVCLGYFLFATNLRSPAAGSSTLASCRLSSLPRQTQTVLTSPSETPMHAPMCREQVVYQPATKSLRMWYRGAGWGAPSGVGVADSTDGGLTWTKHPRNPVYVGRHLHMCVLHISSICYAWCAFFVYLLCILFCMQCMVCVLCLSVMHLMRVCCASLGRVLLSIQYLMSNAFYSCARVLHT